MNNRKIARGWLLVALLAGPLFMGAAAGGNLEVGIPEGWTMGSRERDAVTLNPPSGSPFSDGVVFDLDILLSQEIDALRPLAQAVFPEGSKPEEQSGRKTTLDGYAALEIWGKATIGEKTLSQATYFIWKGTRMIPVSVLARGSDTQAAREMAERIARGVSLKSSATFFPVPGAPKGIVGPSNWAPVKTEEPTLTAKVVAPDSEKEGPPGSINYEVLPRTLEPTLETVLTGLSDLARSRGAERVRTNGVETRAGRRPALVFQQTVDDRLVVTGAVIRYPEATVRVTYFDRPDRAAARKALFDLLVDRLAESEIKGPFAVPGTKPPDTMLPEKEAPKEE